MTQLNLLSQASECVAVVIPVTFFWIWMWVEVKEGEKPDNKMCNM
jgi:hypothetical protein